MLFVRNRLRSWKTLRASRNRLSRARSRFLAALRRVPGLGLQQCPEQDHRDRLGDPAALLCILAVRGGCAGHVALAARSEEHTSELQSLMRISYAVFSLKKITIVMKNEVRHCLQYYLHSMRCFAYCLKHTS